MNTRQILDQRQGTHGDFKDNARLTVELQQVIQTSPNWHLASDATKVATFMILHKLARAFSGDINSDQHWEDCAGYAQLVIDQNKKPTIKPPSIFDL